MFTDNLKDLHIKKGELAKIMGVAPATVSRWGEQPPKYVWAYLNQRMKVVECEAKVQQILWSLEEALALWK